MVCWRHQLQPKERKAVLAMETTRRRRALPILAAMALAAAVAAGLVLALPGHAHAAPKVTGGAKVQTLATNATYTQYDITGDKKPDAIKIQATYEGYAGKRIAVYINGKRAFSKKMYFNYVEAQLITLKNGKPFLYISAPGENDDALVRGIFKYSKGTLKQVVDGNRGFGKKIGYHPGSDIKAVSGNKIVVSHRIMSYMAGSISSDFTYKYQNGTLKKTSATGKLRVGTRKSNTYTALKSMTAYKSATGKTSKFTIKKGQKVKFLKVHVKGNTVRFQVKAGGKTGWIKVAAGSDSSLMYRNSQGFTQPPFRGLFLAG